MRNGLDLNRLSGLAPPGVKQRAPRERGGEKVERGGTGREGWKIDDGGSKVEDGDPDVRRDQPAGAVVEDGRSKMASGVDGRFASGGVITRPRDPPCPPLP